MSDAEESFVLSEGYHDRAFWAGCLLHLGCTDPGARSDGSRRPQIIDPFGDPVTGGQFAFHSKSGAFVRVVPAHGKNRVPDLLRMRLKESATKRVKRLVVNIDSDQHADGSPHAGYVFTFDQVSALVQEFDPSGVTNADGDIEILDGETKISIVQWSAQDFAGPGLPHRQTLERLICAALMAAHPHRGPTVQTWLDSRQEAPVAGPKEYAWSYLAGWHADSGSYEGFCSTLWKHSSIVDQLRPRLEACGAWRVAQALAT
jgi:hypothetical protein